jgi:OOP family OmpA-OmpF porin
MTATLAGCSAFLNPPVPGTATGAAKAECAQVLTAAAPTPRHHAATVILVDRSASTAARSSRAVSPDWVRMLKGRLPADADDVISIGGFSGSAAPNWTMAHVVTPQTSSSRQRQEQDNVVIQSCLAQALQTAAQSPADSPGTDIVQAFADAAYRFQAYSGDVQQLIIATDGLNNLGCLNVSTAGVGEPGAIAAVVSACRASLPRLPGVHVTMLGVGHPASDQPSVTTPQVAWLEQLWTALCQATGAVCDVRPDIDTSQSIQPTSGMTDPPVTFPQITKRVAGKRVIFTIPQSILFDTDSAALSSEAGQAVRSVIDDIRGLGYAAVDVVGFTDARGTDAHNRDLSRRRAQSVAGLLETAGIANVMATGVGKADPACTPEYNSDGTPNLRNMACDRRVEVIVHLK